MVNHFGYVVYGHVVCVILLLSGECINDPEYSIDDIDYIDPLCEHQEGMGTAMAMTTFIFSILYLTIQFLE